MAAAAILISVKYAFFSYDSCVLCQILNNPTNLVKIGPIVMKWQQFFEIQDGGRRHFDFC